MNIGQPKLPACFAWFTSSNPLEPYTESRRASGPTSPQYSQPVC